MSMIKVNNLSFHYDNALDYIFEDVSFFIDTNWKLGFIGRNGKGKTTFLNLLFYAPLLISRFFQYNKHLNAPLDQKLQTHIFLYLSLKFLNFYRLPKRSKRFSQSV